MTTPLFQVDTFAERPFVGNPAAVCLLKRPADELWMQQVAAEMNLSETSFVVPIDDGFGLRWFTPKTEVALCGHGTLAAAHVLWEEGLLGDDEPARFRTQSGWLGCHLEGGRIEMELPARQQTSVRPPRGLAGALGAELFYVGRTIDNYLVELENEQAVRGLAPDYAHLRALRIRSVIATSSAVDDEYDFVSRYFAPGVGVDEDPVTGAAHCCLAPFWAKRLGKKRLVGYQASFRGGTVRARVDGDRVVLSGQAVTVLRGELLVGV